MIHKYSFQNFFSFRDETTFDLVVAKNTPDTDAYCTDRFGNKITKLVAAVGPNASGKTNLLKSLSFITWFMVNSFADLKPGDEIVFKPFLLSSDDKPSRFELTFETSKGIYQYTLEATSRVVHGETLKIKGKKGFVIIFDRKLAPATGEYAYNFKRFDAPTNFERLLRNNASILSTGRQIAHPLSLELVQYLQGINTNVSAAGKANPVILEAETIKYYDENKDIKEGAEEILRRFDLGLAGINITKTVINNEINYAVSGSHQYLNNSPVQLPFHFESQGTRNLFVLLRTILVVLKNGGVAILDEMDSDLHPLMVPEIVNLFTSQARNPKNAQLIFSTHSTQILNKLDKQQIMLVEKNTEGISEAWNLSDMEGVRADDNFYAKYMAGAYGAIPKV